jgi:hypothetical protein
MSAPIEEVESLVTHIMRAYRVTKADIDVTEQALDCCRRIREDAASATIARCELDALMETLRSRASIARMYAPLESLDDRAHREAVERRKAFWLEHDRGFSRAKACKRAAAKLGVSPKTIMRALDAH